MTKNTDIKVIIIFILAFVILGMKLFSSNDGDKKIVKIGGKKYQVVKTIVDTQYVNTTKVVYKEGKTIYKEKPIYVNVPSDVDTTKILKDYYSKVFYSDTLKLDENLGSITIKDTVYMNSIHNRKWVAKINKVTINKTNIVEELPKTQLYIGGVAGVLTIKNGFIGPSIMLKTKKDTYINVNVGFGMDKMMVYQVGIHKPLNFKLWR
jgi:hypothetical protein